MPPSVDLHLLDGEYAVTLLPPGGAVPDWVHGPGFVNVSHCSDELSIVTPAERVPGGIAADRGWRAVKLTGSFDLDQPGIVLSVVRPISENGLGVFVISTYHRDYILIRAETLDRARTLLAEAGHRWV